MVKQKYITIAKEYIKDKTPAGILERDLFNCIRKKEHKKAFKNLKDLKEIYGISYTTKKLRVLLCNEYDLKKESGFVYISLFISYLKQNNLIKTKPLIYKSKSTIKKEIKRFIDYGVYWTDSDGVTHYKASPKSGFYRFSKRFRIIKIFKEIVIL